MRSRRLRIWDYKWVPCHTFQPKFFKNIYLIQIVRVEWTVQNQRFSNHARSHDRWHFVELTTLFAFIFWSHLFHSVPMESKDIPINLYTILQSDIPINHKEAQSISNDCIIKCTQKYLSDRWSSLNTEEHLSFRYFCIYLLYSSIHLLIFVSNVVKSPPCLTISHYFDFYAKCLDDEMPLTASVTDHLII